MMGYDYSAWTTVTGGDFSFACADITYGVGTTGTGTAGIAPAPERGPESALEWLDRRVDEVRVAL